VFATYKYNAGATAAQVAADLAALIAGAAVASLSAGCDKANTSIGGAATGWAVLDTASYGVVKGADLSGADKIARVLVSGSDVQLLAAEAWNVGTHAALNPTIGLKILTVAAQGGVVYLVATPEAILAWPADLSGWAMVGEVTRDSPLVAAGYPAVVAIGSAYPTNAYSPRYKSYSGAGDVTAGNYSTIYPVAYSGQLRAPGEVMYYQLLPTIVTIGSAAFVGYLRGVYLTANPGTGGRLLDASAVEYVGAFLAGATGYVLERK